MKGSRMEWEQYICAPSPQSQVWQLSCNLHKSQQKDTLPCGSGWGRHTQDFAVLNGKQFQGMFSESRIWLVFQHCLQGWRKQEKNAYLGRDFTGGKNNNCRTKKNLVLTLLPKHIMWRRACFCDWICLHECARLKHFVAYLLRPLPFLPLIARIAHKVLSLLCYFKANTHTPLLFFPYWFY